MGRPRWLHGGKQRRFTPDDLARQTPMIAVAGRVACRAIRGEGGRGSERGGQRWRGIDSSHAIYIACFHRLSVLLSLLLLFPLAFAKQPLTACNECTRIPSIKGLREGVTDPSLCHPAHEELLSFHWHVCKSNEAQHVSKSVLEEHVPGETMLVLLDELDVLGVGRGHRCAFDAEGRQEQEWERLRSSEGRQENVALWLGQEVVHFDEMAAQRNMHVM